MKSENQKQSRSHESSVVEALTQVYGVGAVTMTPGSGNQPGSPGDVRVRDNWLVECKTTAKDSITIPHKWIRKVQTESMLGGLRSLLSIRFGNNSNRIYYLIEDRDLYNLMHREHHS
jgi:Holliday junction resolvase